MIVSNWTWGWVKNIPKLLNVLFADEFLPSNDVFRFFSESSTVEKLLTGQDLPLYRVNEEAEARTE